jgi:microcystin-dependent protein
MTEPFIGEIRNFGFTFAPNGWLQCQGQLLPINSNQALFSLLGTTYGGDGRITFALPDLRGRTSISAGQGPGLTDRTQGERGGEEQVTLTAGQVAAHQHPVAASSEATSKNPADGTPAFTAGGSSCGTGNDLKMSPAMVQPNTGGLPHQNMPPYLVTNWCIALQGIFPSRG